MVTATRRKGEDDAAKDRAVRPGPPEPNFASGYARMHGLL
jgi:hypothetical protein